jgi:hypothetical protein
MMLVLVECVLVLSIAVALCHLLPLLVIFTVLLVKKGSETMVLKLLPVTKLLKSELSVFMLSFHISHLYCHLDLPIS